MTNNYLCIFPIGGVDNGRAADLCNPLTMAVEAPAADLVGSDHVLDEEDPVGEAETQFVKELNVLEDVVVRSSRVRVLVIVTVDQQLDDGPRRIRRNECLE